MSGVDLLAHLSALYRPSIRGKKWYWSLFNYVLNVSLESAWRVHCHATNHNLSHLEFLRHVTLAMLNGCHKEVHILLTSPDLTELIMILLRQVPKADVRFARKIPRCKARLHAERCRTRFKEFHSFSFIVYYL